MKHLSTYSSSSVLNHPFAKGALDNFRAGLPALEGQWKAFKKQGALKAAKHGAADWGPGTEGFPVSWNE